MRNKKAFTLIELLVVIAIISLLVSILLPSLTKAKELAQTVKCASQIRQLSLANVLHSENNDGCIAQSYAPLEYNQATESWTWYQQLYPYLEDVNFYLCSNTARAELTGNWGVDTNGDGTKEPIAINYGMNAYVGGYKSASDELGDLNTQISDATHPDRTVCFMDYITFQFIVTNLHPDLSTFLDNVFCHSGKANAAFLDGHVEAIEKMEKGSSWSTWCSEYDWTIK